MVFFYSNLVFAQSSNNLPSIIQATKGGLATVSAGAVKGGLFDSILSGLQNAFSGAKSGASDFASNPFGGGFDSVYGSPETFTNSLSSAQASLENAISGYQASEKPHGENVSALRQAMNQFQQSLSQSSNTNSQYVNQFQQLQDQSWGHTHPIDYAVFFVTSKTACSDSDYQSLKFYKIIADEYLSLYQIQHNQV